MAMAVMARILGCSLITAGLGAGFMLACFSQAPFREAVIPAFFFACAGGIIGAVAGATGEIVAALRSGPQAKQTYRELP